MNSDSSRILEESPDALASRLVQKAHLSDGLVEISFGLISLTMVGSIYTQDFWFQKLFPLLGPGITLHFLSLCLLIGPIAVVGIGSIKALQWVRLRYLIDRVGYVKVKPMPRKQLFVAAGALLLLTFALCAFFLRISHREQWLVLIAGLLLGAVVALFGKLTRFVIGGVLTAAAGVLLAFSRVSLQSSLAILFCFLGLLALVSGSVVLTGLLRQPAGSDR